MMKRRNILERAEKIPHQRKTGYGILTLSLKYESVHGKYFL